MNVTRDDVAEAAGVSVATVSRVYNAPSLVSDERVSRVREAAEKLGYFPDKNASALRRGGSGEIVLLESNRRLSIRDDRIYKWMYSDMISGINRVLADSMYRLSIESCEHWLRDGSAGQGDAVIHHGIPDRKILTRLRRQRSLLVCCCQLRPRKQVNYCYTDNAAGGALAAMAFRKAGLERSAHITGSLKANQVCGERWKGFRNGMAGSKPVLVDGELGPKGGYESARRLLPEILKGRIDSIFVVNDLTAIGVAQALLEAGVDIPGEVSLAGYDNIPVADALPFRLATIDISFGKVYQRATEKLLQSMRTGEPIRENITPVYVPGESVRVIG